jgi:CubicO group peptidase (beta-lactamase class C family)
LLTGSSALSVTAQTPGARFDEYITRAMNEWHIAGLAVAVVKDGAIVYAKGFGVREVGKPERVDTNTVFAIGSNTKLFTAVAAGMLVDEGRMQWDDRLTKFLPSFQVYDPWVTRELTLVDAMSHRSGLGQRAEMVAYGSPYSREEILRRLRYLPPNSSFRSEFGYSNAMLLAAGEAEAAVAGTSWDDLIERRILRPLGMTSTSSTVRGLDTMSDVATPHTSNGATLMPIAWRDIDNVAPAGSINSSVADMCRWMKFLLERGRAGNRRLLSTSSYEMITSPHTIIPTPPDTLRPSVHFAAYGLGVLMYDYRGVKVLTHTGGIDGMLSDMTWVPERGLGIVVVTNTDGHNELYSALPRWILDRYLDAPVVDWSRVALDAATRREHLLEKLEADARRARPANTSPSLSLDQYSGWYSNDLYGKIDLEEVEGQLVVRLWGGQTGTLKHWAHDTFLLTWSRPSSALNTSFVTFEISPSALAVGLRIEDAFVPPADRIWDNDRFTRLDR